MVSISDLLTNSAKPLYSFEFFPPASAEAENQLFGAIEKLKPLSPDFVSVTYGANGSNRDRTINITGRILTEAKLPTMAHLTCVSQSKDELLQTLQRYKDIGVRHILAIRGDMPGGPQVEWQQHPSGLANATQLVELIKEFDPEMTVGVAAFPDIHPQKNDPELDVEILLAKAEAGASFAITQMFFTAQRYFELVDRLRKSGCELPIIPGIQPVTALKQIKRFAKFSGADLPVELVSRLENSESEEQLRANGVAAATELCQELLAGGAPGLHFFTLNRSRATREIYAQLISDS
ncbi:MAG: methylenetetrahydrofolate reductase [NAD(P)H] [Actinomycetales bacterium]|nr:MAG: methylenetetrahydrofolate reductase [NAD(P)H] [Actinomycetales bacterium]